MAFDFPSSPTTGQTYSISGGPTYVYNGTAWVVLTPGNQFNRTVFTATAGQTTFTMNYVVGAIDVYRNGVKLVNTADFTATNGTSIVLLNAATVGDTIEVISYPMITYSDAVRRTGDTMTGALTVPMVITDSPLSFRNRIINGDMLVAQRGGSITTSGATYTLDRWRVNTSGANITVTQGAVGYGGQRFALQLGGAAGLTNVEVQQRIEQAHVLDLVNTQVTVSFWVYTNNPAGMNGAVLSLTAPGAADNWSTQLAGTSTNYTIPNVPQNTATFVSATFTTNSNVANGLGFILSTNTAVAAGNWIQITGVQLEKGSVVTPFERRPYGVEYLLCKRYRSRVGFGFDSDSNNPWVGGAASISMRTAPTHVATNWTAIVTNINYSIGVNGIAILYSNTDQVGWQVTRGTTGRTYGWGDLILDAEL